MTFAYGASEEVSMMMHGWMGWGGIIGPLVWLLLLALIVIGAIALARALLPSATGPTRDDALETLRARFARGEIDEAEYARRRVTLERHETRGQGVEP
jgi:putative membrane protein